MKYEGKELKEILAIIVDKNPGLSSYICYAKAVKGRGYERAFIIKTFHKFVDKKDYEDSNVEEILDYLAKLTKPTKKPL